MLLIKYIHKLVVYWEDSVQFISCCFGLCCLATEPCMGKLKPLDSQCLISALVGYCID